MNIQMTITPASPAELQEYLAILASYQGSGTATVSAPTIARPATVSAPTCGDQERLLRDAYKEEIGYLYRHGKEDKINGITQLQRLQEWDQVWPAWRAEWVAENGDWKEWKEESGTPCPPRPPWPIPANRATGAGEAAAVSAPPADDGEELF